MLSYDPSIFEYSFGEFKNHFHKKQNDRIIFSARYGMGKSTFLKEFFRDSNQNQWEDKYQVYRLYPVNYSISNNDDIIQYIKYDIIVELLNLRPELDENTKSVISGLPKYIKQNLDKVAAALVYMVPKIGKDVSEAYKNIKSLIDEFLKENETQGEKLVDYLEKIHDQEGGLYEYDVITKIISEASLIKPFTKKVLIVDDVDRLDPEHVFRILNVFAAHFDNPQYGDTNKFKFDKVIIVCDFNNIKNIFKHRYGPNADFMGYIDKFFSSEIFKFDNVHAIGNAVEKILYSIDPHTDTPDLPQVVRQLYLDDDFVKNMTLIFIHNNSVSLRSIVKMYNKSILYHYEFIYRSKDKNIRAKMSRIAYQLKLLSDIVGDIDHFIEALLECREKKEGFAGFELYMLELLFLLNIETHKITDRKGADFSFQSEEYNVKQNPGNGRTELTFINPKKEDGSDKRFEPTIDMFWDALIKTSFVMKRTGYLK
jgi:KAP family P-loop domain